MNPHCMDAPVLLSFVALHESGRDMAVALWVTGGYVVPALDLSVFTGLAFQSRGHRQQSVGQCSINVMSRVTWKVGGGRKMPQA